MTVTSSLLLGFGLGVGTPRGPHGVPTPIPHGGGELSLKNPGGGGFLVKPHGVLVGFFMHFYAFHTECFKFVLEKIFFFLYETHKKPPPKPHGVLDKIPHPRGFSNSIPHPHGGWGWGPHGAPVGSGGGVQTLTRT